MGRHFSLSCRRNGEHKRGRFCVKIFISFSRIVKDTALQSTLTMTRINSIIMLVVLTCLMSPVMPRPDRYYNPYYPYYGYYGYYGQCLEDRDCSYSTACYNTYCRDPCIGACGYNANCKVVNHVASCACPSGYTGNAAVRCFHPQS